MRNLSRHIVQPTVLFATVILIFAALACSQPARADSHEPGGRVFEMRTYTTTPGKLENLHTRFRDHTSALFVKHGMSLIAYWTPSEKPNTLVYVLAYPDRKSREASWKAFMDDPEWKEAWAESKEKAGGPIVTKVESVFMSATDYSPIQ